MYPMDEGWMAMDYHKGVVTERIMISSIFLTLTAS
jgi:hypothetical protein